MALKKVAILGATSHVAKNLIYQNSIFKNWNIFCFSRNLTSISEFLKDNTINHSSLEILDIKQFPNFNVKFDVIINCVGFGTPEKIKSAGIEIFNLTQEYDDQIICYLKKFPECRYINFSSGAVYGTALSAPVTEDHVSNFCIDPIKADDYYRISKLHSEAKHRSLSQFSIVDIRLFSFFSRFIDLDSSYLLADIVNSIRLKKPLITNKIDIYRDYIHPEDLYLLINSFCVGTSYNGAIDTQSQSPISKLEILDLCVSEFGLTIDWKDLSVESPTGLKAFYYSNKKSQNYNEIYKSRLSSHESIKIEIQALLIK